MDSQRRGAAHTAGTSRPDDGDAGVPRAFRTRGGQCVVGADAVRLEESVRGYLRNCWVAYRRQATAFTHVVVAFLLLAIAASAVLLNVQDDPWARVFNIVFAGAVLSVFAGWAVTRAHRDAAGDAIALDDVVEVYTIDGDGGRLRPRLVLVHRVDDGLARRYVVPAGGDGEPFVDAKRAFRAADVRVRDS